MVRRLLRLKADPSIRSLVQTDRRQERFRWEGTLVSYLAQEGSQIAHLLREAVEEWEALDDSSVVHALD